LWWHVCCCTGGGGGVYWGCFAEIRIPILSILESVPPLANLQSHKRRVVSALHDTIVRPSGEKAVAHTVELWPIPGPAQCFFACIGCRSKPCQGPVRNVCLTAMHPLGSFWFKGLCWKFCLRPPNAVVKRGGGSGTSTVTAESVTPARHSRVSNTSTSQQSQ